jgi:hypothetical protein
LLGPDWRRPERASPLAQTKYFAAALCDINALRAKSFGDRNFALALLLRGPLSRRSTACVIARAAKRSRGLDLSSIIRQIDPESARSLKRSLRWR